MSSKIHSFPGSDQHGTSQGSEENYMEDDNLGNLPAHIQSVIDGLLDFNQFLGLQATMEILEENRDAIPLSACKHDGVGRLEQAKELEIVESARILKAYASKTDKLHGHEWYQLFRKSVTERVDNACLGFNMPKSIAWAENEIWRPTATLDPHGSAPTIPTPGLHFGFSIQEDDQRAATGFRDDSSFANYTRERLAQLTTKGLHCVPHLPPSVGEATAQTTSDEPQPQSVCFPWAIFEVCGVSHSPEAHDFSFAGAVSQISVTASAALSMFERLAKFADEKHDGQHIPPVIAVTLVGANVTVWLAYCDIVDDTNREHKMLSIWEGNIAEFWTAIQFCRIMDNLLFWAEHCLKHKVTQYLSQWRLRYCPDVPKIHSLLEKDTKIAEIVYQTQDRLSSLGLSANEDLPALVRQAVLLQAVMGLNKNEGKVDPISTKETELSAAAISSPPLPRDNGLEAALSGSIESPQGADPKTHANGKEILLQDSDFLTGKKENGTAGFPKQHNTLILALKSPPVNQTSTIVFSGEGEESAGQNSEVLKYTEATAPDCLINEQALDSKSPVLLETDKKGDGRVCISNTCKKTPSVEESQSPIPVSAKETDDDTLNFVQRALQSMALRMKNGHVLNLDRQRRQDLTLLLQEKPLLNKTNPSNSPPVKASHKGECHHRISSLPNPFVSKDFELSFEVVTLRDTLPDTNPHGPYPTLGIGIVKYVKTPPRTDLDRGFCRMHGWVSPRQPIVTEPLSPPLTPPLKGKVP